MTKTGKVAKLNKLNPGPFVEIHPDDAARLHIAENDQVEIASRRGRAVLPAVITDRVRPGNCFAPFHWNDAFGEYLSINAVTNDAVDPISTNRNSRRAPSHWPRSPSLNPIRAPRYRCHRHTRIRTHGGTRNQRVTSRRPRRIAGCGSTTHAGVQCARPLISCGHAVRASLNRRSPGRRGAHPAAERAVRFQHPAVGGRPAGGVVLAQRRARLRPNRPRRRPLSNRRPSRPLPNPWPSAPRSWCCGHRRPATPRSSPPRSPRD